VESDGRLLFEQIIKMDLEGIVCKQKDSPYKVTEKPSRYWIKSRIRDYQRRVIDHQQRRIRPVAASRIIAPHFDTHSSNEF